MRKIWRKIASIAAAVVVAFSALTPTVRAMAEEPTTSTTSVMQDLTSAGIDKKDYPTKTVQEVKDAEESHLQLIRIAESVNDELFLYVYQPCDAEKEIEASKVVINQTANLEETAQVLDLKLVSSEGVFDKYLVQGLKVLSSLSQRYYSITSIMRRYDKDLDADKYANTGGDIKYVPETVAQIWYAGTTADGAREYGFDQEEVITVTDKYHGTIRYSDGFALWQEKNTDSHFIAFTTDHKIEDLRSAEIYYDAQYYVYSYNPTVLWGNKYRDLERTDLNPPVKKIKGEEKGGNAGDGWLGHKYEWDRIEKLSDFYGAEKDALSSETKEALERVQSNAGDNGAWILRFLETKYTVDTDSAIGTVGSTIYRQTIVSNVAILKLTFRTAGITYTMGVVDTMVTPDTEPDGEHDALEGLWLNLKDAFNNLQKTLRGITLAIGAVFGLGIIFLIGYGISKLIDWILAIFHRRK